MLTKPETRVNILAKEINSRLKATGAAMFLETEEQKGKIFTVLPSRGTGCLLHR